MISLRANAAIHYLPLSESGAPDWSPIQDGHRKADGERHGFGVIAERPTGAGLALGMGLRDIAAKPDWKCSGGGRQRSQTALATRCLTSATGKEFWRELEFSAGSWALMKVVARELLLGGFYLYWARETF